MKRQAAEKRGLWGQVFGVVRIAAKGKKGTAFFDALPFIITALVLVIASMRKNKGAHIPAHLGENYFREER